VGRSGAGAFVRLQRVLGLVSCGEGGHEERRALVCKACVSHFVTEEKWPVRLVISTTARVERIELSGGIQGQLQTALRHLQVLGMFKEMLWEVVKSWGK
jgi:hypothetical protein